MDHGQHVILRFRTADDVVADGLGGIGTFQLCDGAESVEQFPGFRRPGVALELGSQFFEGVSVHPGMLADIECV